MDVDPGHIGSFFFVFFLIKSNERLCAFVRFPRGTYWKNGFVRGKKLEKASDPMWPGK